MAMDKYGVEQVRKMQKTALADVRAKLEPLRSLQKTAAPSKTADLQDQIRQLERQEKELQEALAEPGLADQ